MTAPNPYHPQRPRSQPPPLPPRPRPPRRLPPGNGLGTAGLVLGIIALVFAVIPIVGVIAWFIWPVGLVLALIGFARVRSGEATNRGPALAGVITSGVAAAVCLLGLVITAVGAATRASGHHASGHHASGHHASGHHAELSAARQCLRPHDRAPAARHDHRSRARFCSASRRRYVGQGRHL